MSPGGTPAATRWPQSKPLQRIAEPLLWFAALLILWEALLRLLAVPLFVLPPPSAFLRRLVEERERLLLHGLLTTEMVLYGFTAGVLPGIALGYLIARSRLAERSLYPLVVFVQGLPKITLAPLLLVWFGFTDLPKIVLTALVTFFPVLVDSAAGFRSIDPRLYYVTRSAGASWWRTFRHIEVPSAAPSIFSGCRITIVVTVTVVIVVEWLNSNNGLGYLVLRAMDAADTPLLFAILVVGSTIGVVLSYAVDLLERLLLPWRRR